jgi:hypothetical protein
MLEPILWTAKVGKRLFSSWQEKVVKYLHLATVKKHSESMESPEAWRNQTSQYDSILHRISRLRHLSSNDRNCVLGRISTGKNWITVQKPNKRDYKIPTPPPPSGGRGLCDLCQPLAWTRPTECVFCLIIEHHIHYLNSRLDRDGQISAVYLNHCALDSVLNIPLDKVRLWYEGYRFLAEIMMEPKNLVQFKLTEGRLIVS